MFTSKLFKRLSLISSKNTSSRINHQLQLPETKIWTSFNSYKIENDTSIYPHFRANFPYTTAFATRFVLVKIAPEIFLLGKSPCGSVARKLPPILLYSDFAFNHAKNF